MSTSEASERIKKDVSNGYYPFSYAPYGYIKYKARTPGGQEKYRLKVDEEKAEVVRRIYREYACDKTIPEIIAGLTADGIPAPSGGAWKIGTILRMLFSKAAQMRYRGHAVCNTSDLSGARKERPIEEWTIKTDEYKAILTADAIANVERMRNSERHGRGGARRGKDGSNEPTDN